MAPPIQGFKYRNSLSAAATDNTGVLVAPCGASRGGGIQLSGTWTATVLFEQTLDNGTTWIAKTVYPAAGGAGVTTAAANGQWKFPCGGETHVRARCSAFTSGPIVVDATFTAGVDPVATPTTTTTTTTQLPASLGVKAPAASMSVVPAGLEYETVAAGQTAQAMGATGATGDYLSHVVFQPGTLGAGTSTVSDNATVLFTYTAGTLSDLRPITFVANAFSVSGAWKITTGANMTAVAFGDFT